METDQGNPGNLIDVEVAYATPDRQRLIAMQVLPGTTAYDAVLNSGITDEFPELDIASSPMGIFSEPMDGRKRPLPGEYLLESRDRIEIYRPLLIDPEQARLKRTRNRNP